jgi:hypothetical protein
MSRILIWQCIDCLRLHWQRYSVEVPDPSAAMEPQWCTLCHCIPIHFLLFVSSNSLVVWCAERHRETAVQGKAEAASWKSCTKTAKSGAMSPTGAMRASSFRATFNLTAAAAARVRSISEAPKCWWIMLSCSCTLLTAAFTPSAALLALVSACTT